MYEGYYGTAEPGFSGTEGRQDLRRGERLEQLRGPEINRGGRQENPRSPDTNRDRPQGNRDESRADGSATLVVSLPPDATLTIDDSATQSTSGTRVFTTPPLTPGKVYHYQLKANLQRDGRTVSASQRVEVRAGEETRVALDFNPKVITQE
jgi:uncharacterized protein (TIGR03000 family)